jgi:hypothetical protein
VNKTLRKFVAACFIALGVTGIFAVGPSAVADPLIKYSSEGEVDPDDLGSGGPLACVNPHIEIFGNTLLEDPICVG